MSPCLHNSNPSLSLALLPLLFPLTLFLLLQMALKRNVSAFPWPAKTAAQLALAQHVQVRPKLISKATHGKSFQQALAKLWT
jgi:hypothetical protein